ncbi:AI-2E family transporter [Paraglaciecola hydrolytica]|uniref:Transporter n=1 Tax=Paraglaciecola hydrolytica TaxID=1799789 RepID=A0A136A2P5_9ALTE|nr:AI-2E family transporter [Paraglaciecola hydrolytica]KXI29502.1 transporter [Paraglaciecola hydrolytica]
MSNTEQDSAVNAPKRKIKADTALVILAVLALLYTLYLAQTLFIPFVVTLLIALLMSPLVTMLERVHVPRFLSALVLLTMLIAPFSLLGVQLAEPVQKWAKLLPQLSLQFSEQINSLNEAIHGDETTKDVKTETKSGFRLFGWFSDESVEQPKEPEKNIVTERIKQGGMEILVTMLAATPIVIAQILTGLVLILFLLIFGPSLFQAYVDGLAKDHEKRQAISLVGNIQRVLSRYISTISLINLGLGACTALCLQLLGVEDALLWGVLAAMLNFIPYVGSLIGLCILSLAGLTQYGMVPAALVPPLVYLMFNIIESQFVTPTILGKHMRLNPLIVILWLIIWGWLWGAVGVLLAVPLLVCIKLIIGQLGIWHQLIAMLEAKG